mgnify:CR=1 FL=1
MISSVIDGISLRETNDCFSSGDEQFVWDLIDRAMACA